MVFSFVRSLFECPVMRERCSGRLSDFLARERDEFHENSLEELRNLKRLSVFDSVSFWSRE